MCKRGLQFWTSAPKVAAHACACFYLSSASWFLQSLFGFSSSICKEKKEAVCYPADLSLEMPLMCYLQPSLEKSHLCYSIEMCSPLKIIYIRWFHLPFVSEMCTPVKVIYIQWFHLPFSECNDYVHRIWQTCVWRLSVCSGVCMAFSATVLDLCIE